MLRRMSQSSQLNVVAAIYSDIRDWLNERQRRLLLAASARALGRGGQTAVAEAAGVSRALVRRGEAELEGADPAQESMRIRRPGGGRKRAEVADRTLLADLDRLISPDTRGDPESPLRWTCKSTRQLADTLNGMGHQVSHVLVGQLLHAQGYSLQANAKVNEGRQHPDRDAQFTYLNERVKEHLAEGAPALSVDTKKKELVGEFKNGGREWRPQGQPEAVNVHDFPDEEVGKAIPYGIYDMGRNSGWVSVGQDHDTASFAVEALRRWWQGEGSSRYGQARRLLISADCGGSNGNRSRLWKTELAKFAAESGLAITVCHLPPGTSKWNKIEHRLFSHISTNWRGRPLTSHEVVVDLIRATTTRTGLRVHAELDSNRYPTKVQVSDQELHTVPIVEHEFHGEWNYTISPAPITPDRSI
jgi:DDE family transposase